MPYKAPLFLPIRGKEAKGSRVQEPTVHVSTIWAQIGGDPLRTLTECL